MTETTKIILRKDGAVEGLLTVTKLSVDIVWRIFDDVKYELDGCWTTRDLLEGLRDRKVDFIFEEVEVLNI